MCRAAIISTYWLMKFLGDLILSQENQRLLNVKTSWVWQAFAYLPPCDDKQKAEKPCYKTSVQMSALLSSVQMSANNGAKCDSVLVYCGGTTNMATHLRKRHSKYVLEHDMTNTLKVDIDKNTSYGGTWQNGHQRGDTYCVGRLHTGLLSETAL